MKGKGFTMMLVVLTIVITLAVNLQNYTEVSAGENIYIVAQGDTLYGIGRKYGVSVKELKELNVITNSTIKIGQKLRIPISESKNYYRVKPGDTLYSIARTTNVKVEELKQLNNLEDSLIIVGQKLYLGEPFVVALSNNVKNKILPEKQFTAEEVDLLARMIHAEARGESYEGKVAVGAVIINRIKSSDFPSTLKEVIYQPTKKGYQFTPVQDGSINLEADEISIQAAYDAINGLDPTNGSLFFYNPDIATDQWIQTLPVTKRIGNHLFAR